jgi:hypothetical protein
MNQEYVPVQSPQTNPHNSDVSFFPQDCRHDGRHYFWQQQNIMDVAAAVGLKEGQNSSYSFADLDRLRQHHPVEFSSLRFPHCMRPIFETSPHSTDAFTNPIHLQQCTTINSITRLSLPLGTHEPRYFPSCPETFPIDVHVPQSMESILRRSSRFPITLNMATPLNSYQLTRRLQQIRHLQEKTGIGPVEQISATSDQDIITRACHQMNALQRHSLFLNSFQSIPRPLSFLNNIPSACLSSASDNEERKGLILACPEDRGMLNEHLVFLRQQIEFFRATIDDIMSYTRGRNKGIAMQQVGIRCRHCSHIPAANRRKGSTYFPSALIGIYQAALNINVEHLQSGVCTESPHDVQSQLLRTRATKTAASGAGKAYWAESARTQGLIDTEDGIRFATDALNSMLLPASMLFR